tara:strand:+ start:559 stop:1668 length:1110 start_codon:yes stop_codon:yes gene_type:complete
MKISEIKVKNLNSDYSVFIGTNILNILPKKIKSISPKTNKIGIVVDSKVPKKFLIKIKKLLKNYELFIFKRSSSEKFKSYKNINIIVEKCLKQNFNRSDILISLGGGIIGDFSAFAASMIKRGLGFINIPTTLLAQVDSAIGGKTGVNSKYGKNLIGSFYQPLLVLSDIEFLNSLSQRQMICGYAEILKHSLILDKKFFKWLNVNSNRILQSRNVEVIKEAIYRSCQIKLNVVNKDVKEKNLRMILNFGHTFAHAIEAKNSFSNKINHGEAVLIGMMLATKLSYLEKIISKKDFEEIIKIYKKNNLNYSLSKFFKKSDINKIINFMNNDKKNDDQKINLILLKKIGKTTSPGSYKMSINQLRKKISYII